jgi:hypothetical protein
MLPQEGDNVLPHGPSWGFQCGGRRWCVFLAYGRGTAGHVEQALMLLLQLVQHL